jgi:hypothetical protein
MDRFDERRERFDKLRKLIKNNIKKKIITLNK